MHQPQQTPRRILVADDEPMVRSLLLRALESAGYDVTAVEDGVATLDRLQQEPFDLLLVDVWMPRMTGFEVLHHLKGFRYPPKAIVMTGDNTPVTVMNALREQAQHVIGKPFTIDALFDLVRGVLASTSTAPPVEVVSATRDWIELLLPCDRETANRVDQVLSQLETDLPADVRESVGDAFRELLLNAVEWGGQLDPRRWVRIACLRGKRVLLYRISDPGGGFRFDGLEHAAVSNPPDDPARHAAERERRGIRPGGFGILMARAIADELIYNEAQNEVVFMKYLDKPRHG